LGFQSYILGVRNRRVQAVIHASYYLSLLGIRNRPFGIQLVKGLVQQLPKVKNWSYLRLVKFAFFCPTMATVYINQAEIWHKRAKNTFALTYCDGQMEL